MPKNIVQDIIVNRPKRSLREILPKGDLPVQPAPAGQPSPPPRRTYDAEAFDRRAPHPLRWIIGLILLVLIVGGFVVASTIFAGVTVKVTPRQGKIVLEDTFTASRVANVSGLSFNVVTREGTETKTVPTTGTEKVARSASGQIIIYNNYSAKPQNLIANTRFATPAGKIYRIKEPVTVPGIKTQNGNPTPGSIEATIFADQPGDSYNLPLTDFKIPGFKGDPRYDKFYARSKTPLAGGFVGEAKVIAPDIRQAATAELTDRLTTRLLTEIKTPLAADVILYDGAILADFTVSDNPSSNQSANQVILTQSGQITGFVFPIKNLSRYIAERKNVEGLDQDFIITNLPRLTFKLVNQAGLTSKNIDTFSFTLTGTANLVWQFDAAKLASDLVAARSDDYQKVFANFPTIERAEVIFRPPWVRSFPKASEKIWIEPQIEAGQ